jgi:membrane associated rhomboid family serine protease
MPFRDHNRSGEFPLITILIILANTAVFVYELTLSGMQLNRFISTYALVPANVSLSNFHSLLPFLTSMFVHAGFLHIFSNMLFLWVFGDNIEAALGKIKYIFFYLLGGILATAIQYLFIKGSLVPLLGASGAIASVLGAYLILFPRARVDVIIPIFYFPFIFAVPAYLMLIYWFIIQVFSSAVSLVETSSVGGVAFVAHIAGFLAGIILIKLLVRKSPSLVSD